MQLADIICVTLAASIVSAAPMAQSWQDSVDEAMSEASAAIHSGTEQAEAGAQTHTGSADATLASAGLEKRQNSWRQDLAEALAGADASVKHVLNEANPAIGKRQP